MAKIRHAGNTTIKRERRIRVSDLDALKVPNHGVEEDLVWNNKNGFVLDVPDAVADKLTSIDKKFERVDDGDEASTDNVIGASGAPSGDQVADRSDDVNHDDPNA